MVAQRKESSQAPSPELAAKRFEYEYYGHPDVLPNFARSAHLPRDPNDHSKWLIIPGGGTRGAVQAGMAEAAVETGFFYGATDAAAISVGSAVLIGAASKNKEARQIFYQDNLIHKFIDFGLRRLVKLNLVDLKVLETGFRETYPTDIEELRNCPVSLYVGKTPRTGTNAGNVEFVDIRASKDPIKEMMASVNLPWITTIPSVSFEENGEIVDYNDCGMPTGEVISHAIGNGARDILFFMNEKFDPKFFQRFFARVQHEVGRRQKDPFLKTLFTSPRQGIIDMEKIKEGVITLEDGTEVRVAFIGPTENRVKFMERDWLKLRRAVFDGYDAGKEIFGNAMKYASQLLQQENVA